jgi:hypothetical protein
MSRRRLVTALVASAGVLGLAGPAGGVIVPQKGMAGVRLGWTNEQVRATLGDPLRIVRGTNDFGAYTIFRYPYRVQVVFQGNVTVTSVTTTGRRERTVSGAGVATSETRLRALLPAVRCRTEGGVFRHCWLGRFVPGRRVTDFQIRGGLVRRVVVGFVID